MDLKAAKDAILSIEDGKLQAVILVIELKEGFFTKNGYIIESSVMNIDSKLEEMGKKYQFS